MQEALFDDGLAELVRLGPDGVEAARSVCVKHGLDTGPRSFFAVLVATGGDLDWARSVWWRREMDEEHAARAEVRRLREELAHARAEERRLRRELASRRFQAVACRRRAPRPVGLVRRCVRARGSRRVVRRASARAGRGDPDPEPPPPYRAASRVADLLFARAVESGRA